MISLLFVLNLLFLNATESDPYTLSDIRLEDSSPAIDYIINNDIQRAIIAANTVLKKSSNPQKMQDTELEVLFSKVLLNIHFSYGDILVTRGLVGLAIGQMENCILFNNCRGWPFIERIILNKGESITINLINLATKAWLTPILNVCGIRIGADRLFSLFDDGFRYYNVFRNGYEIRDFITFCLGGRKFLYG